MQVLVFGLGGVVLIAATLIVLLAPVSGDQRFTLWTTFGGAVGTVIVAVTAALVAANLTLRHTLDAERRERELEALGDAIRAVSSAEIALRGMADASIEMFGVGLAAEPENDEGALMSLSRWRRRPGRPWRRSLI